ncbi:MAG: hypothetical protein NPIRA02_02160 [Nitrospirales bacterium]|nr:MAG: hypothetical protein NPIRA02_02160 [Nitrospirales bacterium]
MEDDVFGFAAPVGQHDPVTDQPTSVDPFSESLHADFVGAEPINDLFGMGTDPFSEAVLAADLPEGPDLGFQVDLTGEGSGFP